MEKIKYLPLALLIAFVMTACSDNSGSTGPEPPPEGKVEASDQQQFVYNAMNYWYYWQDDVPDLADNRFDSDQAKQNFLTSYTDAEALFEDLLYIDDDFSVFIEDYEEYQEEQDGIFAALGFEYGFIGFQNTDQLVGYVRYIIPGSPADDAGLQRLDLFTEVDGTQLSQSNANQLLTNDSPHTLTLADIEQTDQGVSFPETGTVDIASEEVIEDPVYLSKVIESNNAKIGYMVYNAFRSNSHQALNDVMSDFKSQGIDELVLDLRYNSGGAVITSQLLASMISGLGSSDTFAEFTYNPKRSEQGETVPFLDVVPLQNEDGDILINDDGEYVNSEPINTLSLNRVYVLVSRSTASASEALINGLSPYMNVSIIGTKTVGKDEGSLLLVDAPSPYLDEDQANPDHKNAILPIVLKIVNSQGEAYPEGFTPAGQNNISEITVENLQARPALGDPEDPLLARALSLITGEPTPQSVEATPRRNVLQEVDVWKHGTSLQPKYGKTMYIEPYMIPSIKSN